MNRLMSSTLPYALALFLGLGVYVTLAILKQDLTVQPSIITGWLLFACLLLLLLFGIRKRLPTRPSFNANRWRTIHIVIGLFASIIVFHHTHFQIPSGPFERLILIVMFLSILTGLSGIALAHFITPHIQSRQEVIFERIPSIVLSLQQAVAKRILLAVEQTGSKRLAHLYTDTLNHYFIHQPLACLMQYSRIKHIHTLLQAGDWLPGEQQAIADILQSIEQKARLDRQYCGQMLLKYWLFIHVPVAMTTLPLILVHIIVVYAFSGSVL